MPTKRRLGRLYRLDPGLKFTVLLEGIGCANGMGFTRDRTGMYFTDSAARSIYLFDYDERSGSLTSQRLFHRTSRDEGVPDGLTVEPKDMFGQLNGTAPASFGTVHKEPKREESHCRPRK